MGYIPPPGESGSDKNKGGKSGSGSGTGSTIITIPNPSSIIPQNPSIGLKLFGPLVPASDNTSGLCLLAALQFSMGCVCIGRARSLRSSKLVQLNVPNTFVRKLTKYSCLVGGSYLAFQSGLEITRLILPYDPWVEEAKYYRKVATKNGDVPSWWFGATGYYKPMSFKEWNEKVQLWLKNAETKLELEIQMEEAKEPALKTDASGQNLKQNTAQSSGLLNSLARKGRYSEIYEQLHDTNTERVKTLLDELKDVNELNKAKRLDLILEGKGEVKVNPNYSKPHIQLGNHRLESDEDLEIVWLNFDPWDELKLETEYDIRLIPRKPEPSE